MIGYSVIMFVSGLMFGIICTMLVLVAWSGLEERKEKHKNRAGYDP